MHNRRAVTALSIAGSDPSGGAGIQADLKAFSALGAYGMTAICALTAQNTQGVRDVFPIPAPFVAAQLDAIADDIAVDAVKIGMLADPAVITVVADFLDALRERQPGFDCVVLDPVMVATSGDRLLPRESVAAVRTHLLPRASLITPNLHEAAVLLGTEPANDAAAMQQQAAALRDLGAARVLVKAGSLVEQPGCTLEESVDCYADVDGMRTFAAPRIHTRNTHGTGCSLSSAIAALRPQTAGWPEAVRCAKDWLTGALEHADELGIGHGRGPIHHFYAQESADDLHR